MTIRERVHQLADELPEAELPEVLRFLEGRQAARSPQEETPEARRARIFAMAGSLRDVVPSSEQIAEWRRQDAVHEEERSARRRREEKPA